MHGSVYSLNQPADIMRSPQMQASSFPLPFPFTRIYREHTDRVTSAPFLISAMFTEGYLEYAGRLARSCDEHGLQYVLYEIPSIHHSTSPKGTDDPSFTKANFIHFLLEIYRKPILYLDADCVVAGALGYIEKLVHSGSDFAIYNWLADEHTESYVPVKLDLKRGDKTQTFVDRFYRFSHSIDYFSVDQLLCSGAVQFYNNSVEAKSLLRSWHRTILENPHTADDECLDFAFNNRSHDDPALKFAWLKKAYARYAWWIYERPVINHPEFPCSENAFRQIQNRSGARRLYPERTRLKTVDYYFPKDCLIDSDTRMLMKVQNGQLVPWRPLKRKLWL